MPLTDVRQDLGKNQIKNISHVFLSFAEYFFPKKYIWFICLVQFCALHGKIVQFAFHI
jgi:hypothetical protein